MPTKRDVRKVLPRAVRWSEDQLKRIARAAEIRGQQKGEWVTQSDIIREGALQLADEILRAA